MLVEGVYIYLMVIKVFRGNVARRRRIAYIVGWGRWRMTFYLTVISNKIIFLSSRDLIVG
jgi:hypothetical protein